MIKGKDQITWSHIGSFSYTGGYHMKCIRSIYFRNRWNHWVMLINNEVKLIIIARQFTKAMAISFFGSSRYERCVRSCYMLGKML